MKLKAAIVGVLFSIALAAFFATGCGRLHASSSTSATPDREKQILAVLDRMVRSHETYLSVPPKDGQALRLLAQAIGAKNVAEIGTSTGYSGLWLCLALQATGGHLTTFEINHDRASQAREHFKEAGVLDLVTIIEGDAHQQLGSLKGTVDLAFVDADKEGYLDYLHKLLFRLRPGGLVLAHNVDMVPEYVRAVTTNADLETIFYMQGAGLAVTLKKR